MFLESLDVTWLCFFLMIILLSLLWAYMLLGNASKLVPTDSLLGDSSSAMATVSTKKNGGGGGKNGKSRGKGTKQQLRVGLFWWALHREYSHGFCLGYMFVCMLNAVFIINNVKGFEMLFQFVFLAW